MKLHEQVFRGNALVCFSVPFVASPLLHLKPLSCEYPKLVTLVAWQVCSARCRQTSPRNEGQRAEENGQ